MARSRNTEARARIHTFVTEYCKDFNGVRAATAAGYKAGSSVGVTASQLLSKAPVKRAITRRLELRAQRHEVTIDRTVAELAKIAFVNVGDFMTFDDEGTPEFNIQKMPREATAAISEVTVLDRYDPKTGERIARTCKVRMCSKNDALNTILKHLGGLVENHRLQADVNVNHTHDLSNVRRSVAQMIEDVAKRVRPKTIDLQPAPPAKLNGNGAAPH